MSEKTPTKYGTCGLCERRVRMSIYHHLTMHRKAPRRDASWCAGSYEKPVEGSVSTEKAA